MKSTVYRNSERNKYVFRYVNTQSSFGDSEVPVEDWEWFLEMFSNQHQGWLVNVFRYPAEKKHEKFPQIIDRPLTHIGIDRKLSRPEVQISAAGSDSEAPIYQVPDPTRLILKQDSK